MSDSPPIHLGESPRRSSRWLLGACAVLTMGALLAVWTRASTTTHRPTSARSSELGSSALESAKPTVSVARLSSSPASPRGPGAASAGRGYGGTDAPEAAAPAYVGEPARVPEAYTGDPEGRALWEKTVEEDQQTLQADDLIPEPPREPVDLSKIPALQHLHLDADGNVNE